MTSYKVWCPGSESREGARSIVSGCPEDAAIEWAEQEFRSGEDFESVSLHVTDGTTVWLVQVMTDWTPEFFTTTAQEVPSE